MTERPYDGTERRKTGFPGETEAERSRALLAHDARGLVRLAAKILEERGVFVTPESLATRRGDFDYPEKGQPVISFDLRMAIAHELKNGQELPPELEVKLRASFDASLAVWGSFDGFWENHRRSRHTKPSFDEYRKSFGAHQDLMQPGRPEEFDKGYEMVSFVPSLPAVSENADDMTLITLLKITLEEEFRRSGEGKEPNTLIVQTRGSGVRGGVRISES